jgi:hypothetical protein
MRWFALIAFLLIPVLVARIPAGAKDKKEPDKGDDKKPYLLVVPPVGGKEVKLFDWRFTLGTRRIDLENDKPANPKAKTTAGPEYLEFREEKSTTFLHGILTLVPLASIKKLDYDREKKKVSLVTMTAGDKDATLAGWTKFVEINKLTIEAEVQLGDLGAATVKFQGGVEKGLQSIAFPSPKAAAEVKGTASTIIAIDKDKTKHTAHDLRPLYHSDGSHRALPYLMFKKTVKIDMDKIVALRFIPSEDKKKISYDFDVTLKDGMKYTLTLLTKIELDKGKSATLDGLIGQVPAGYKLFPAHTIQELQIGDEDKK